MRRRFTRRLERLAPVLMADGAGGWRRTWEARGTVWAEVRAMSGGLTVTELGEDPRLRLRIAIHALPEGHVDRPVQGDRFREGRRLYDVDAVHEADPAGRYLTCHARAVPTEGVNA